MIVVVRSLDVDVVASLGGGGGEVAVGECIVPELADAETAIARIRIATASAC